MKMASSTLATAVEISMIALACSSSMSSQAADCITAPPGLVGWWPGDNHTRDISGNVNDAHDAFVSFAPGQVDSSFDFSAGASSLRIAPSPELAVKSLTLAAWINPRDGE